MGRTPEMAWGVFGNKAMLASPGKKRAQRKKLFKGEK